MNDQLLSTNSDLFRATLSTIGLERLSSVIQWLTNRSNDFPKPISVHLNLTLRCTAKCTHCKQWTWPSHAEFTRDQIQRVFDVFSSWGVKSITFGGGNPLLYGEIEYALKTARESGFSVGIITEGITLSESLADNIGAYASWIRFSLDGPTPDIHNRIRNTHDLYERVVNNITRLRVIRPELPIGINCVVQKDNYRHLSEMIQLAQDLQVSALLFKLPHGDDPMGRYLLTDEAFEDFKIWVAEKSSEQRQLKTNLSLLHGILENVFEKADVTSGRPVRTFYSTHGIHCYVPLFFIVCDSEGNIYPCDYLQADTRLWDGQYSQVRNEFKVGNILLEDSKTVLDNLRSLYFERIIDLPSTGFPECGCCTRFFQINGALSTIAKQSEHGEFISLLSMSATTSEATSPFL